MNPSNSTFVARTVAVLSTLGWLALVGASEAAAQAPAKDSYTWSAELVAFDKATSTATVKSRLVEHSDHPTNLAALRAGDAAMLTWSGIETAAGIRAIERGSSSSFERMTLPIEYVSSEADGRYVSFKVQVPTQDVDAIAQLAPGAWVTATSPHRAKNPKEAVSSMRPYANAS
jgi:hypothetical protein